MEFDRLPNELQHFLATFPDRNAARKIGNISAQTRWTFFYNHHVTHKLACFFGASPDRVGSLACGG